MTAPSEAQSLRDAVAQVLDPFAARYGDPDYFGPDLGKATYSARLRVALKTADAVLTGPIGAHIAKIEAAHAGRVATLTARIADLEAALERIACECDPDDPEWHSPAQGRRLCFDLTRSALSNKDAGHE